jgi:DNA-directed RNA polymerase subunit N (RpoN/RPB10)
MLIYIRCPTCNSVLGNKRLLFKDLVENRGYSNKKALDALGLKNMCCRIRMISFVDVVEYVLEQPYYDFKDDVNAPSTQFLDGEDTTSMDISKDDSDEESNTIKII